MSLISLIHPSRSRPFKSAETIDKWFRKNWLGVASIELLISLDVDDPSLPEYKRIYGEQVIVNKNRNAVDAINHAAKQSHGDILIVVSDDTDCPTEWDSHIINSTEGKRNWILKTNDGTQPWIITMPVMDRAYYSRQGYVYYPGYNHNFCDTELTCVADLTGRKLTSNILFKHNHYSVTKEPQDHVSKKADATWDQGEKLFLERYKRNFDLPPDQIKGKIQDSNMINWLLRKQRK